MLIFALFWSILWNMGYSDMSGFSPLEKQTYAIMANIKWLIVIALYIAWRVTPENKK